MSIKVGHELLHYRLVEKIGEGGMGVVYAAEDTKLRRRVALKVLPLTLASDPTRLTRFQREAQAVAALNHPNIVTLHSVEQADTPAGRVHFITMELVDGQSLTRVLSAGKLTPERLLEIAVPLADAVSRAHREGITHRDLKPDNIMLDADGRLRVLDFGLARQEGPLNGADESQAGTVTMLTEEGKIVGTVAYMSPEQAEGKFADPRSDVFSLGTILYEMVSGRRPFVGETSLSLLGAILRDDPPSVAELNPAAPPHLARVIRRCLAKDPDRRYQTALELRNELEELKRELDSGADISESRPVIASRANASRLPWIVGASVVLAAMLAVALTGWLTPEPAGTTRTSRPITSSVGWEADLNWSPEAEFIAFGQIRNGSMDIMVQPVAGGEAVVRADGPGDESTPRWSPDGKHLAYVSSSEPGTPVYIVPPHGGTPRKLVATNIGTLDIENLSVSMGDRPWSSDSRSLLVSRTEGARQMAIYRVDRDNGHVEQLSFPPIDSNDVGATFSFDGTRIAFERRTYGRGALFTMPAEGGEPVVLLAEDNDIVTPSFRPDDRHILFRSDRGGTAVNLWELELATGRLTQLTFETRDVLAFSLSAQNRIAYGPFWHDTFLFVVDVASGERRQLTSHSKDNFGARFSPDGATVAYHSTRTGNSEVFLHHLDGRPETQITDDPGWDLYPDWSPDGEHLIFNSDRQDGRFKIMIAGSDGGGARLLVDQPISVRSPWAPVNAELVSRWSPDSSLIAYLLSGERTTSLWTVRPDGEGARSLIDNVTGFDWYRDTSHGLYTRPRGSESELVAVNLETGAERLLFAGPFIEMDVAPDGSAVSFCYGPGHLAMGLVVLKLEPPADPDGLPRAVGEPEYVVRTTGTWHVHNGGWSADSKTLVYTQDMDHGDIFELVESR